MNNPEDISSELKLGVLELFPVTKKVVLAYFCLNCLSLVGFVLALYVAPLLLEAAVLVIIGPVLIFVLSHIVLFLGFPIAFVMDLRRSARHESTSAKQMMGWKWLVVTGIPTFILYGAIAYIVFAHKSYFSGRQSWSSRWFRMTRKKHS